MDAQVKLGRIAGIPIGLHYSWFLVFALVTASLTVAFLSTGVSAFGPAAVLLAAVVASLLFFVSVVAHELGHALVATRNGVVVRSINLFIFGGVAQITREPPTPGAEFRIAVAGPLTSLTLGVAFGALWLASPAVPLVHEPAAWLARINVALAVFNMLPAFPLDGGRVLRALVWSLTGNLRRATILASGSGQLFGLGFAGLGVVLMIGGGLVNGLWLVFIGWFLRNAASASSAHVNLEADLDGVTVGQVMSRECVTVAATVPLDRLVQERILGRGQHCFYVADEGSLLGMLTVADVSAVPRARWPIATTGDTMVPRARLVPVTPDTPLMSALRLMDERNVDQLPVVDAGRLLGTLARDQMVHYVRARSALQAVTGPDTTARARV
jgi:Zn-dependent protease/CBS domain-containing protein